MEDTVSPASVGGGPHFKYAPVNDREYGTPATGPEPATLTTHKFVLELAVYVVNVVANKGPPETELENESNNPEGQKTVMDPTGKEVASVNVIVALDAAIDTWVT